MASKLTITNRDLLKLQVGLNSLDAVKTGKEDEIRLFEFSRKVKWNLTKNTIIVNRAKEAYDLLERQTEKKNGVFKGMKMTDETAKKVAEHVAEMEDYKDQEIDLEGILLIKLSDLLARPLLDDKKPRPDNEIPQSTLTQLVPIIEEESVT